MNKLDKLYQPAGIDHNQFSHDPDAAHLVIHGNEVVGNKLVPGLIIKPDPFENGIKVYIEVEENIDIKKPVHLCFGLLPEKGVQKIDMNVIIRKNASIKIQAHCVFPNAEDIEHTMDAVIRLEENSSYSYLESHVHGKGGIKVIPKAVVYLGKKSRFKTEFELLKGRVGYMDIDYEGHCEEDSVMEITSRVNGGDDDMIKINETGYLNGKNARGALTSKIAVSGNAKAEVFNKLVASGEHSIGHVDCKEVIRDNAKASAYPMVEVNHPKARVTHEASIGTVDNKQLETLMSRGMDEEAATDLIISGMLS